jgi:hypothetical protein
MRPQRIFGGIEIHLAKIGKSFSLWCLLLPLGAKWTVASDAIFYEGSQVLLRKTAKI